jgi:glucose/arabinose dehydrogenase
MLRIGSFGELRRKVKAGMSVVTMRPDQKVFEQGFLSRIRGIVPGAPIDVYVGGDGDGANKTSH